ncbi:MAG: HPr kinase/phosphorylase, partial [Negativibacillus sp.]|nr:HPr kinase/phosphorylase [Negativibacillus sp.]
MAKLYSVALSKLIEDLKLEMVYMPRDPKEIMVTTVDINRPGLQLCGFYDYFDSSRIQLFGLGEFAYMEKYTPEERKEFLDRFFSQNIPAVIISRNLEIPEEMVSAANIYGVPLLRTNQATCDFMATMIATLKVDLAPRITRHGVLVEVYGEGILLLGESGVGKSETAIELIKRG